MSRYEDKKKRLKELFEQQEKIESEIKSLLEPERVAMLPLGFSMNVEVFRVVELAGTEGIRPQEILQAMQRQYPDGIDRKRVASALAYLKNAKHEIEQTGRGGAYRVVSKQESPSSNEQGDS